MIERARILRFAEKIARQFQPQRIILFGSCTYGTPTPDSDVDLLVVMRHPGHAREQAVRIRQSIDETFPMDLIVRSASRGAIAFRARSPSGERRCMKATTAEWIEKAEEDCRAAKKSFGDWRGNSTVPNLCCV